jgi:hypothetical protein
VYFGVAGVDEGTGAAEDGAGAGADAEEGAGAGAEGEGDGDGNTLAGADEETAGPTDDGAAMEDLLMAEEATAIEELEAALAVEEA